MYVFLNFLGLIVNAILNYIQLEEIKSKTKVKILILELTSILLGSKILDFIINYKFYDIYLWEDALKKGYMFYGGILLAIILIYLYCKIEEINTKYVLNILIPNILVTYGICKIGCFFNGCCVGINDIPIQIIECIICLSFYVFLKISKTEKIVAYCCILFGIIRILDFALRKEIIASNLVVNELISSIIFMVGVVGIIITRKMK